MELKAGYIVAIVIFVILIAAFAPVVVDNIANANNQYECLDDRYQTQSTNLLLCSNTSNFSAYNTSSTYVGTSATENTLLGLVMLFIVLSGVFMAIKAVKGGKAN